MRKRVIKTPKQRRVWAAMSVSCVKSIARQYGNYCDKIACDCSFEHCPLLKSEVSR
jgi:hypothetical protein